MKREGYKAIVEYIALNDEPMCLDAETLIGQPSVQVAAIAFGKTYEQVAEAVVKFRIKHNQTKTEAL